MTNTTTTTKVETMQRTELKTARAAVNACEFGSPEWHAAAAVVREITSRDLDENPVAAGVGQLAGRYSKTYRVNAKA